MQCNNDRQFAVVLEADRDLGVILPVCRSCARRPSERIRQFALGEKGMSPKTMENYRIETEGFVFPRGS